MKEKLNLLVERLGDIEIGLAKNALDQLKDEVRGATTSVTSVPKSFKYLKDHYQTIKDIYSKIMDPKFKVN